MDANRISQKDIIEKSSFDFFESLVEKISQAEREAIKRDIEANAVAINDELIFSKLKIPFGDDVPVVCGLKCILTKQLPDDISFMVFKAERLPLTTDEEIQRLKDENSVLREKLMRILEFTKEVSGDGIL